jgi:uncharacterized membrane protein (UPF0127 family)
LLRSGIGAAGLCSSGGSITHVNASLRRVLDRFATRSGIVVLTLVAAAVFAAGIAGVVTTSGDSPSRSTTTIAAPREIDGYTSEALKVVPREGAAKTWCVAVAKTAEQQSKGMMGQDSFGNVDGMVFTFENDTKSEFYMANVKIPLAVAFFDGTGQFVSASEMPVCKVEAAKCPRYAATAAYRTALEVPAGGLGSLGVGDGANVTLGGPCI